MNQLEEQTNPANYVAQSFYSNIYKMGKLATLTYLQLIC